MKPESLKALLKKIPLVLLMFLGGGAYCRWYQLQRELLKDGSLADGAFMHRVLLILTITFFVGFAFLLYSLKNISTHKDGFGKSSILLLPQFCAGILLIVGNILAIATPAEPVFVYTAVSLVLTKYLPYLGILAGICIILFAILTGSNKTPSPILYMIVSIYLVVRLIVCFQDWNMDPSVHDYSYKLLAAITTMLGCFQISGFSFGKGKRRITIFWCLYAGFFCSVSLPDYFGDVSNLLIITSLLVLSLVQGLQLLYAPDSREDSLQEGPFAEVDPTSSTPLEEGASSES